MSDFELHIEKKHLLPGTKSVILAFVTKQYAEVAENWVHALRNAGIERYVICCFDRESFELLRKRNVSVLQAPTIDLTLSASLWQKLCYRLGFGNAQETYRETDFAVLWKTRFQIILNLLHSGYEVIHSDLDAVWLDDPVSKVTHHLTDYDIVGSIVEHEHAFPPQVKKAFGFTICMGFICLRPTPATIRFLEEMYDRLGDDQEEFNLMLLERDPEISAEEDFGYRVVARDVQLAALSSTVVNRGGRGLRSMVCHPNSPKRGETTKDVLIGENLWFL